jgi:predicted phage tail protein
VILSGLIIGQEYTVTVRAVNEIGESNDSNNLTIFAGTTPSQIKFLKWESSNTTSVTVRWTLPNSNGGLTLTKFTLYYDLG